MKRPGEGQPAAGPHVRVVGVAVLRTTDSGSELLAARRTHPAELAGRWELPGGKCVADESLEAAARRELAEELGIEVRVTGRLRGVERIRPGLTLEVVTAEITDGTPTPAEHDAVRWLSAAGLRRLDWLDPDVPFLDELEAVLRHRTWGGDRL